MSSISRIGLIADTHMPPWDNQVKSDIERIFAGVDLILHAGDIVTFPVLDWLETIAPVLAAIGNNDTHLPPDPRLKLYQQLEHAGVSIGVFHVYEPWHLAPHEFMRDRYALANPPDVIVVGDTHFETIEERDGVLMINPGSPTTSHLRTDLPGTVGILTIADCIPSAQIVLLTEGRAGAG